MSKPYNMSGTDLKSVLLNISSLMLFIVPFVWYFTEYMKEYFASVMVVYAIAYLMPPTGWRRPHPYSDDPNNVPMGTKRE